MTPKRAYDEIQRLAVDVASFPLPGTTEAAASTLRVAEILTNADDSIKKTASRWSPPYNFAIRPTTMGCGLWTFTILPYFPVRRAYREDLNGVVVRPMWRLMRTLEPEGVKTAAKRLQGGPTIAATVDKELTWIERQFDIKIPADIRAGFVANSLDQARRRWGISSSRIRDRLIPLDGAMPRDL